MTTNYDDSMVGRAHLSAEEENKLVDRLYSQSLSRKEATLAELQARYYPVAAPLTISSEALQKSVKRQVDEEMEQRRQRRAVMDATAAAAATGYANRRDPKVATQATISPEEVEVSVRRMYDETLARKKANMAESEKRYAFHPEGVTSKKMPKDEFQASVERMSKPKKTEFTTAEINKIYGL
ncbi:hypothetical protein ABB37_03534 [Leptomonas pyrrhocoris]|uniref:Uncharacterized protein n=1 Tax=Leptomonas pyrrhocoris TaxID=157538 RepID=A0A0N0VG32_LEPPY|nr:hypothetical protein ABB37_03534 [Leptomonas pyrrhocoris]XP_015660913.1 hypothetical protein ABB37_03534 [Leptomonas pyrrhocoris]KPA82473.1 hypothetical protein ABB37_03534 [Leptomonas pyrrhocoris]KPA82474.1 hypothetical protein ABB37_03534 [Leptomonas pyrrhocoris]|eukprot:XP_015660912.1 hypothetical protein ABB37_03534 [Leptomonas pyrrhocoris]